MARILVVDDAVFIRKLIAEALASPDHQVVGAADTGEDAVARFESLRQTSPPSTSGWPTRTASLRSRRS